MDTVGVGLLGCGVVGSAVARRLMAAEPATLAAIAVRDTAAPRDPAVPPALLTDDPEAVVDDPRVEIVVEVMGGLDPARALVQRALALGKPVVTANKALLGAWGPELRQSAAAAGVPLRYEAAVCGAIPLLRGLAGLLDGDRIIKLEGVLNGTANFVLTHMEQSGGSLASALSTARDLGYAEADPTRDIDGSDTADKLALLVQEAFGATVRTDDIPRLGIDWLTPGDVTRAVESGRRWRLLATAVRGCAKVEAVPLRAEHPLARLRGPDNGVLVTAERAGTVLFSGPGAGGEATASAILADLTTAVRWCRDRAGAAASVLTPA